MDAGTLREIIKLFQDIQTWMIDNDYECGPVGAEIYDDINKMLKNLGAPSYPDNE